MLTTNKESTVSDSVGVDIVKSVVSISIDLINAISEEYAREQVAKKKAMKDACIALIESAIADGERISKHALVKIIPCLAYCNSRAEIAQYIGISIEQYDAGVKRWYHIF